MRMKVQTVFINKRVTAKHLLLPVLVSTLFSPSFFFPPLALADNPFQGQSVELLAHDLSVELFPDEHKILAADKVSMKVLAPNLETIAFMLHPALRITQIRDISSDRPPLMFTAQERRVNDELVQVVTVQLKSTPEGGEALNLQWVYEGSINDPPREPRHLRFVTPSETSGHIGKDGVYLSSETHWYPDLPKSLATFRLQVRTPEGWESVSNGRLVSREVDGRTVLATWKVSGRDEALTLVANHFVKKQLERNGVTVATYLFPEDAQLADEYLEASAQYLDAYTKLLGSYPFPKFAVVENFFASGLGMPSYTLLGAGSIRRRYIQPYALGHEIVHSWIGNHVFNDDGGNWVEGLTTYLSNYYWYELQGDVQKARDERKMMLWNYALYVPPDQDYPIAAFKRKTSPRDNAIGYHKAAMVFHMLRRKIGDERFFGAIRMLVKEDGGRRVGWHDLERVFSRVSDSNLREFFARWVEQPGALEVSATEDPDYELFRRIPRREIPPILNLFVTDPQRVVIVPDTGVSADLYGQLAERVVQQGGARSLQAAATQASDLRDTSVLLLGGPLAGPAWAWAMAGLPAGMELAANKFRIGGKEYTGENAAVLFSFRNPDNPEHVVSVFYGLSPEAVKPVMPLLFFYGWNSHVVFEKGRVIARD